MNAPTIVLLIALILTILFCILDIIDKCIKAHQRSLEKMSDDEGVPINNPGNNEEVPKKVLSFKRAMKDISNNV